MKPKRIYICEDSIEGVFTSIYDAWSSRYGHDNNRIEVQADPNIGFNMELFSEYIYVATDEEKVLKLAKSIQEKISEKAYEMACQAIWSNTPGKADTVYRFLILGFANGSKIVDCFSNDTVMNIFNMSRSVGNEAHHITGFLRFTEGRGNILLAKLNPKNDILRLIAPHFSDRFGQENFIIYDEKRETAIVHRSGYPWFYTRIDKASIDIFKEYSEQEEIFRNLWKTFFNTIAIEERKNSNLQRNNLPLRFRSNMLEFNTEHE